MVEDEYENENLDPNGDGDVNGEGKEKLVGRKTL